MLENLSYTVINRTEFIMSLILYYLNKLVINVMLVIYIMEILHEQVSIIMNN